MNWIQEIRTRIGATVEKRLRVIKKWSITGSRDHSAHIASLRLPIMFLINSIPKGCGPNKSFYHHHDALCVILKMEILVCYSLQLCSDRRSVSMQIFSYQCLEKLCWKCLIQQQNYPVSSHYLHYTECCILQLKSFN